MKKMKCVMAAWALVLLAGGATEAAPPSASHETGVAGGNLTSAHEAEKAEAASSHDPHEEPLLTPRRPEKSPLEAMVALPLTNSGAIIFSNSISSVEFEFSNPYVAPAESQASIRLRQFQSQIDMARRAGEAGDWMLASSSLTAILDANPPSEITRVALLEMAIVAQRQNEMPKAQQILGQYVKLFPQDPRIPEVFLRQGLLFRQMGANTLALSKFYALMTTALNLKLDRFDYYKRLVLHAQTEIAETYYLQGDYKPAADFFGRLLKLESPDLNKSQIQFKLVRSLANMGRSVEVEAQARDFIQKFPDSAEQPEVRFLFATALRQQGRNSEALQQVLLLLKSQQAASSSNPENWLYWQQRTGNDIANQLYKEGDYVHALEIYFNLAQLDRSPVWQFPVMYQIGLVYEKLQQPEKAAATYNSIIARQSEISTNATASLQTLVEMAQWRQRYLGWQGKTAEIQEGLKTTMRAPQPAHAPTDLASGQ